MRIACCLALAAVLAPAAPAQAQGEHVLLVVVPARDGAGDLKSLAELGGLRTAVASPAVGRDDAAQAYLDMSQGARVSTRVYGEDLGPLRLTPAGRISGWPAAAARAEDAPGDIVPGLLGEAIRAAGGRTAYIGARGDRHAPAVIAADAAGAVDTARFVAPHALGARANRLLRDHSLVVAQAPAGLPVVPRREGLLVIVVAAPRADRTALLPTGATLGGDGPDGLLTSRTTRRPGMVALTDYAPTVLDWLGIDTPDEMQGRTIETASGSWEDAQSLADRLGHIKDRRGPALRAAFGAWLLLLAALALAGRARLGLRLGLLMAIWLPGVALLTGALDPARGVETAALALAPLGLAALTDRLLGWPRAPALAAGVVLGAHAIDLVAGSPLIVRSLAGPNPGFGARFYGIGNELEAILSATVLLGTGALLWSRRGPVVPAGFALVCAVAAVFMGAGRLGADVGGVITLAAGAAAAVLASLPGGISRRAVVIAVLAPVLAVCALAAIDLITGGDAHLTRTVLDADSPGELVDVAERRFEISWENLKQGTTPLSVGVFALVLAYGIARRRELLAPLAGDRAFAAGMWGTLAATVVGALANDSGPTIFLIGALALVLAGSYVTGKPPARGLT